VKTELRIGIVGSRDYPDLEEVWDFVDTLPAGTVVVSGGARGVDREAEEAARARGLAVLVFHADWRRYGPAAGPIRNAKIAGAVDRLVAFWDGESSGTMNTIQHARLQGKAVEIRMPVCTAEPNGNGSAPE
jgi:predicted Rossmann fold nucleotide-binding protein DprA/Smf involved in DNA uptake